MSKQLLDLINLYGKMKSLDGYTRQSRGQQFNELIANMLQCWGFDARCNIRSVGEIDVAFSLNSRQVILEAKWETDTKVDIGPIAKLEKRIKQRLGGTIGIFLSMSGYTEPAIREINIGSQSNIIALSSEHFEAMLSGFFPPEELIGKAMEKASFEGCYYSTIIDMFSVGKTDPFNPIFGLPGKIPNLVIEGKEKIHFDSIISNLPFGQIGVSGLANDSIVITQNAGLFTINYSRKQVSCFLPIPNCSGNPIVTTDGTIYIARKSGVAKLEDNEINFVAGGEKGIVSIQLDGGNNVWALSNRELNEENSNVIKIGDSLGSQINYSIEYKSNHASNFAIQGEGEFIVCGSVGIKGFSSNGSQFIISPRELRMSNPNGLINLSTDEFLIICNDVELWRLNIQIGTQTKICKLALQPSVYELSSINSKSGFLAGNYTDTEGRTKGLIAHWELS